MTPQEIFTTAFVGLKAQGFQRSVMLTTNGERCKYRGPKGRKCAIGHCIPDDIYDPKMDLGGGVSARALQKEHGLFPEVSSEFLFNLQDVHDLYSEPDEMEAALIRFGRSHGLNIPN